MSGWIKLHRRLLEKGFYSKDSQKVHLWIHLLMKANRKKREEILGGKPIMCNPGQFTCGRKQLSLETGINESKIERILTYFEKTEQQIEQQKTTKNRLITIVSWDEYQGIEQEIEQQVNNNRTTSEQQVNTLQESKEFKESKEVKKKSDGIDFEKFWNLYDLKKGKKDKIEKKWNALSIEVQKEILEYIPKYKQSQPDKQYRKHPETFLNNEAWKDEIIVRNRSLQNEKPKKIGELELNTDNADDGVFNF